MIKLKNNPHVLKWIKLKVWERGWQVEKTQRQEQKSKIARRRWRKRIFWKKGGTERIFWPQTDSWIFPDHVSISRRLCQTLKEGERQKTLEERWNIIRETNFGRQIFWGRTLKEEYFEGGRSWRRNILREANLGGSCHEGLGATTSSSGSTRSRREVRTVFYSDDDRWSSCWWKSHLFKGHFLAKAHS